MNTFCGIICTRKEVIDMKVKMRYTKKLTIAGLNARDCALIWTAFRDSSDIEVMHFRKRGLQQPITEKGISLFGKVLGVTGYYDDFVSVSSIYINPTSVTLKCKSADGVNQLISYDSTQISKKKRIEIIEPKSVTIVEFELKGKYHMDGEVQVRRAKLKSNSELAKMYAQAYPPTVVVPSGRIERVEELQKRIDDLKDVKNTLLNSGQSVESPAKDCQKTI